MDNKIMDTLKKGEMEGLSFHSLHVGRGNYDVPVWIARITWDNWLPAGEGDGIGEHDVQVDYKNVPKDIKHFGRERWPDTTVEIVANPDEVEKMVADIGNYVGADYYDKHTHSDTGKLRSFIIQAGALVNPNELIGQKEFADILGWDRRKVATYYGRGVLPDPVKVIASGPLWTRKQAVNYKKTF